jgi:hypothetical protein
MIAAGGAPMKMLPLLVSPFLAASLLSASGLAAPSNAPTGMRTRTEPALACLLGFEGPKPNVPWMCLSHFFERGRLASSYGIGSWIGPIGFCAQQHFRQEGNYCPHGPLEAVDYLGTNAAGADVYDAQYMNADVVYIIPPPGPDGKSGRYWIKQGPPGSIIPSSLVRVTSPATQKMALYRRPSSW